jgi:hypothetical protein
LCPSRGKLDLLDSSQGDLFEPLHCDYAVEEAEFLSQAGVDFDKRLQLGSGDKDTFWDKEKKLRTRD